MAPCLLLQELQGIITGRLLEVKLSVTRRLLLDFQVLEMLSIQKGKLTPQLGEVDLGLLKDMRVVAIREVGFYNALKIPMIAPHITKMKLSWRLRGRMELNEEWGVVR